MNEDKNEQHQPSEETLKFAGPKAKPWGTASGAAVVQQVPRDSDFAKAIEGAVGTALQLDQGTKHDEGKDPWHLLPPDALRAVAKVLAFGAKKYAPRNWELGMDWHRPYAGLLRHMGAWWEREPTDPESGMSHLWHAGFCILVLISYELRGIGTDDRPLR